MQNVPNNLPPEPMGMHRETEQPTSGKMYHLVSFMTMKLMKLSSTQQKMNVKVSGRRPKAKK